MALGEEALVVGSVMSKHASPIGVISFAKVAPSELDRRGSAVMILGEFASFRCYT